jgi:hypothetical protein
MLFINSVHKRFANVQNIVEMEKLLFTENENCKLFTVIMYILHFILSLYPVKWTVRRDNRQQNGGQDHR